MSDKKQAPVEVVSIFTIHGVEGPVLSGTNTVNNSKHPGAKLSLTDYGVIVEHKAAKVLVPFSNIKSIILK
jgi:hypothetical protein